MACLATPRITSLLPSYIRRSFGLRLRCSGLVGLPQDESLRFMAVPFAYWLFSLLPERRDATGFHLLNRTERKWFTCFVSNGLSVLYGSALRWSALRKDDEQGHYCLRELPLGDYDMTADDPDKGYPSMTSGFFRTTPLRSRVSISTTDLNGHADWKIPYRAGFDKVELVDAQSGKPIVPMFFDLVVQSRPEVGHMYGSTASTTALLVPQ